MENHILLPLKRFTYEIEIGNLYSTSSWKNTFIEIYINVNDNNTLKLQNFKTYIDEKIVNVYIVNNLKNFCKQYNNHPFIRNLILTNTILCISKNNGLYYPTSNLSKKEIAKLKLLL